MNIYDNIDNTAVNPEIQSNVSVEPIENKNEENETEEIGEHDIVIEEDFQINLEVAEVSKDGDIDAIQTSDKPSESEVDLGTEQSGNITF